MTEEIKNLYWFTMKSGETFTDIDGKEIHGIAFVIEKQDPNENECFIHMETAIDAIWDGNPELFEIKDIFDILKAGIKIASNSRRAAGNTIYTSNLFFASAVDAIFNKEETPRFKIIFNADFEGTFMTYEGKNDFDQTISYQLDRYWIHPDWRNRTLELVIA